MLFIRAGVHKMLVKIADMEDPDQTVSDLQMQSDLILLCFLILYKHYFMTSSYYHF